MSGCKPLSERQKRHRRSRNDMVFGGHADVIIGANKQEDFPAVTVSVECLPEFEFLAGKVLEAVAAVQREANELLKAEA